MATFTKVVLSGSTNGRGLLLVPTATPGTTVHTAHATSIDEIWLYAQNSHTANVALSIEYGGTTDPGDVIVYTVPADDGLHLITPGLVLTNSLVVSAFAGTASVISLFGYVNRIG